MTVTILAGVWLNGINVPGAISSGEEKASACRKRVPPRSRHSSILPLRRPTCVPSRAHSSGRADPSATMTEALSTWNWERIESSNRRSIALSGFHSASKRSCKQTARLASATHFQYAYCTKRNDDGTAMGRMLISDESTSLGIPGM